MNHSILFQFKSLLCFLFVYKIQSIVNIIEKSDYLLLSNDYVYIKFSILNGIWISDLRGDYQGKRNFTTNLLSPLGIRLERENADGSISNNISNTNVTASVIIHNDTSSSCVSIEFPEVYDDVSIPLVVEAWIFNLCEYDRSINFKTEGYLLDNNKDIEIRSIRHSLYALPLSSTAFYDKGVVQIMAANSAITHFGSSDRLTRTYFMGGIGAIDITRNYATGGENDQTVLLNADSTDISIDNFSFMSGFHEILIGNFSTRDIWCSGSNTNDIQSISDITTYSWTREWNIFPNNRNFPTSTLGNIPNLDNDKDLEAYLTGIYGSAVPCLCTYPNEVTHGYHVAQIATTLRYNLGRGYDHNYNFFDPDNFMTLSAILYSGDEYLQDQARLIIERTGEFILESTGQIPHHFSGLKPTYSALSGEVQTGPNSFWIKTALRYAAVTGNFDWLKSYLPKLRLAASYVFSLIDKDMNLLKAPGSLMIDVFIRNNYTSDSNAMIVGLLREFADVENLVGDKNNAIQYQELADLVVIQMNKYLWSSIDTGDDHYITQLNPDFTTRDFVDYDANLIAIANKVSNQERSIAIQKRIASGQCSASQGSGPQFVSEVYYGPEDTTNGNIGDSWCSMGRIAWYDAHGRKRFGTIEDLHYFNKILLEPIQNDLIKYTWLHERYGCDGLQQTNRTMYYFEYPSLVTMLIREIRYGIEIDLSKIHITPFLTPRFLSDINSVNIFKPIDYEFHMGNLDVIYSNTNDIKLSIPGSGLFNYKISSLLANTYYTIHTTKECNNMASNNILSDYVYNNNVQTNSLGDLEFIAPRGSKPCVVTITLQSKK